MYLDSHGFSHCIFSFRLTIYKTTVAKTTAVIHNKYGLSIGDEINLAVQGDNYKLTLVGTFRDDYGRTVVVPYECFKNTKDEYYAEFILPSSYD